MKEIMMNTTFSQEITVDDTHLACHVGSGSVAVYATPMMIALMENTAVKCLLPFLEDEETSVGVMINTTHDAATPPGMKVYVTATITAVDRKKVNFHIVAMDEKGSIGTADHERFVVNKEKFEQRATDKLLQTP